MMRGWAFGLLALLFLVTTVPGGLPFRADRSSSPYAPVLNLLSGQVPATNYTLDRGIDAATARPVAQGKREREPSGDDPLSLPTLLVVAIALFYALPLRGSDVARSLRIGLTPEGRYREAGRCPTGPPAFAG